MHHYIIQIALIRYRSGTAVPNSRAVTILIGRDEGGRVIFIMITYINCIIVKSSVDNRIDWKIHVSHKTSLAVSRIGDITLHNRSSAGGIYDKPARATSAVRKPVIISDQR